MKQNINSSFDEGRPAPLILIKEIEIHAVYLPWCTAAFLLEWKTVLVAFIFSLQQCFVHIALARSCFDSLRGYCFTVQSCMC